MDNRSNNHTVQKNQELDNQDEQKRNADSEDDSGYVDQEDLLNLSSTDELDGLGRMLDPDRHTESEE